MSGSPTVQRRLLPEGRREVVPGTAAHPPLSLLGCLFNVYWVAESDGELVLVDQHAASERVVFDALLRTGRLARQELVVPLRLTLTPRQRATLGAHEETIQSSGFEVEPFGAEEFRVRSVPSYRGHLARPEALPALLDEIADGGRPTVPDGLAARRAASVACHASVRGGDRVPVEQMGRILQSLYGLPDAAYACPHGRPIVVRFPRPRVDRWFLRPRG